MKQLFPLLFLLLVTCYSAYSQNSVGINTSTPNQKAVLELVSPNNNQGFLVPRLTTAQRNAMTLATTDRGLMVYDTNFNQFWHWDGSNWKAGLGVLGETAASGDLNGTFPEVYINDNAVGTSELTDVAANVGTFGAANDSTILEVTVDVDGRVTGVAGKSVRVGTSNIYDASILNQDIANTTITISKLDPDGDSDKVLVITPAGAVSWADRSEFTSSSLATNRIYIGDATGTAEGLPVGGDVTVTNDGTQADFQLGTGVVTNVEIADETIQSADIEDGSIASVDILDETIEAADINTGAVTTSEILDETIISGDIQNETITVDDIGPDAVGSSELIDNSIASEDILDETIAVNDIGTGAVGSDEIIDESIEAIDINTSAVTTDEILDETITTDDILNYDAGIPNSGILNEDIADNAINNVKVQRTSLLPDRILGPQVNGGAGKGIMVAQQSTVQINIPGFGLTDFYVPGFTQNQFNSVVVTDGAGNVTYEPRSAFSVTNLSQGNIFVGSSGGTTQLPIANENGLGLGYFVIGGAQSTGSIVATTIKQDIQIETDGDAFIQDNAVQGDDIDATNEALNIAGIQVISLSTSSADAQAIQLDASAGGIDIGGNQGVLIDADNGNVALDAIAGSVIIDANTNITLTSNNVAINPTSNANITTTTGNISLTSGNAVNIAGSSTSGFSTSAGDIDINAAGQLDLDGGTTVAIDGATGVAINSTASDVDITGNDNANITATNGDVNITGNTNIDLASTTGDVTLTSGDAVLINSSNQTTIDGTVISIDGTDNTNLSMTANDAAAKAVTIGATNTGGLADVDITAQDDINLTAGGNVNISGGITLDDLTVTGTTDLQGNTTIGDDGTTDILNINSITTLDGNSLTTTDGTTINANSDAINLGNAGTDAINIAGDLNAANGIDVTAGDVDIADNLNVTTNATITGDTRVDGTFQFDAAGQSVDNIQSSVANGGTGVRADGVADESTLVTEAAVREALVNSVTADNGLNEDPDGNIQLGGNLLEATTITNNGFDLVIDGATGDVTVDSDGLLTAGNGVDVTGGDLDVTNNANITGNADVTGTLTTDGLTTLNGDVTVATDATTTTINSDAINLGNAGTDAINIAGDLNAANGIDVTAGDVDIADNLNVTTNATITGDTRVDGNFQFDAAGQSVDNIQSSVANGGTGVRADGVADESTLVTEAAVREALVNSVTADNGLNEDPDGNIQLGGNLLEATTITNNGFDLVIDGATGDVTVDSDGLLTAGNGVDVTGGDLDVTNNANITGNADVTGTLTTDGLTTLNGDVTVATDATTTTINSDAINLGNAGTDAINIAGDLNAANGIDVTAGDVDIADNLNVTTNATITGDTRVDGTFQFDAAGQSVDNIQSSVANGGTGVRADGVADESTLVTEAAVREALVNSVTADNGLNEDPDGNIQLGGNLLEATTITNNGFDLVIDGATGDVTVDSDGLLTAGNGVDVTGGDLDVTNNANITGNADVTGTLTTDGLTTLNGDVTVATDATTTTINSDAINLGNAGTDAINIAGDLNAANGIDVTAGDVDIADNLNVTTNATITGDTRVDGNFQFDAAGQSVDNIQSSVANGGTGVRADGVADESTLVTEAAVREALVNSVTADNGLNEDPDGNIQLGGNLLEATTITNNGFDLVIDGATGDVTVDSDGLLTAGNGVDVTGGDLDVTNNANITGNADVTGTLTTDGLTTLNGDVTVATDATTTTINSDAINLGNAGTDAINIAGDLNAANGIDVTAGDVDIADNLNVTTNATITGDTRVDGTFQFDAAGQSVDNIQSSVANGGTGVRADGVADESTLVTEAAVREALVNSVTADNGLNEDPDGNIQLGGNLLEATTITNNGFDLVIDGATGDVTVDSDGLLTAGNGVDVTGGDLDVTNNANITGNADVTGTLTTDGLTTLNGDVTVATDATTTTINSDAINLGNAGTDAINIAGDLNAANGIDVTAGDVDIADNLNVTTNATITGDTRVDGTFQFDAAGQSVDNIQSSVANGGTGVRADGVADESTLVTEAAVREALVNSVTADNGLNEDPDGNIQLGGNLLEATTITNNGFDLVIDGATGDVTVDSDGLLTAGNGVDVTGGDLDVTNNANITGNADVTGTLTTDGLTTLNGDVTVATDATTTTINSDAINLGNAGTDAINIAGDLNAANGIDVTAGDVDIADNLNVTTNATITGDTRVDGNFQFDAAGQSVDNIQSSVANGGTGVRADGVADESTLVTEAAVREALVNSVTADNGLNEDPDGNIQLGGNLLEATTITNNGFDLVIDGATGDVTVDSDGLLTAGNGVDVTGGDLDVTNNANITGNADVTGTLTADGLTTLNGDVTVATDATTTTINSDAINLGNAGTDAINIAGDLNAANGIDVTAGDVDIADNLNVTTNATITGDTRVDGNFQFDAAGQSVDNIQSSVANGGTGVRADGVADESTLVTEAAVREALVNSVTADNGLNEDPDGNIQLGGNLLEATTITNNGFDLVIDGATGDVTVDSDGLLTAGNGVDVTGGDLDVTNNANITGNADVTGTLTTDGLTTLNGDVTVATDATTTTINSDAINLGNAGTDAINIAGDLNAANGIDVTAGDVDIADNLNVTTNATITGDTRVDGNFQFDAAGQSVDNIQSSVANGGTGVRADGVADESTLVTEAAVREALVNSVTADNGLNEDPDGNIQLGGNLLEATTITNNGFDLVIDGATGDVTVDSDGLLTAGNGVDVTGGDLDVTNNANITGNADVTGTLTADGLTTLNGDVTVATDATTTTINSDAINLGNAGTDAINIAGDLNAANGIDVTAGDVDIADNLNVTTNATITGDTRVDGNFQFDAAGQSVDNIQSSVANGGTGVRADGVADESTLVTEAAVREALVNSVTADNGLNEDPDGNIQLGGNLLEATTITNNGFDLVIDGATGDVTVDSDGLLTAGNGVDVTGGDLDVTNNANITGNADVTGTLTTDGLTTLNGDVTVATDATTTTINSDAINLGNAGTDAINIAGDLNAANGIDVTAGDVDIADNLNVTTNATITGDTRVDGTFQFDAAGQSVDNIQSSVANGGTGVRADGVADESTLVTEAAVREALVNSVTADNGLNEDPDGNIQLGGNLLEATTITNNGFDLVIDGATGDVTVDSDGLLTAGNGVDVTGGDLDVTNNANITGNADVTGTLTTDGLTTLNGDVTVATDATTTTINSDAINLGNAGTDAINIAGDLNAANGIDVTAGDVDIADNLNVTTNATITGDTRVDGNFQFDAAGQSVDNIQSSVANGGTGVRADGVADESTLVTEAAVREALVNSVTADNGLNEDPDGNIQLGGNLLEATTITNNGFDLVIDGATGDVTVDSDGLLTAGNGVDVTGGDLDVTNNANITGNADVTGTLTTDGLTTLNGDVTVATDATTTTINSDAINLGNAGTDAINIAGDLNAANGIDVTAGDVDIADNLNVTTNATITGDTRVDGNFQFDAAGQSVDNIQSSVANGGTGVRADGVADESTLVTEAAVREALVNSVTADNGLNEDPDGNIQLGGNLLEATTITNNGFDLVIDGATGDVTVDSDGLLTAGNGVDVTGGDLDVTNNANITGNADVTGTLTTDGLTTLNGDVTVATDATTTTINSDAINLGNAGTDAINIAGDLNAANGIDVTAGDVDIADNLNVTTNATITGDTRVDGTFQFDAGQTVDNIATTVRATGLTDDNTLVTESAIRAAISAEDLTDGEGTTANGTAIDLGGTVTSDRTLTVDGNDIIVDNNGGVGTLIVSDGTSSDVTTIDDNQITLTDGTNTTTLGSNSLGTGSVTATGTVQGGTLTDGTASINSGAITGATNITGSGTITGGTLTDGAFSVTSGAVTGVTTLNASGTVSSGNLSTTGNIDLDGNFQFDAGQTVDNIATTVRATGLTDDNTLVTESAIRAAISAEDLTDGEGTTANGTAIDLGGTVTSDRTLTVDGNDIIVDNNGGVGTLIVSDGTSSDVTTIDDNQITLTDGTNTTTLGSNSLGTGSVTATGTVQGGTLTDGTASINSGAITGATNITGSGTITGGTLTDGAFSVTSGAVTGVTTLNASGVTTLNGAVTLGDAGSDVITVTGGILFDEATQDLNLSVTDQSVGTGILVIPDLAGSTETIALLSDISGSSDLQAAYVAGNIITTDGTSGPITMAGDQTLNITSTGGANISGGTLTISNQQITQTGTGQVTFGGNVAANSGLGVSGAALTINNQAITQTTGGQVTFAGNVDANGGVDVTGDATVSSTFAVATNVLKTFAGGQVAIGYSTFPGTYTDGATDAGIITEGANDNAVVNQDADPITNLSFTTANTKFAVSGDMLVDGQIGVTGVLIAGGFTAASDRRLKENIHDISGSLEAIQNIQGVSYNWKKETPQFRSDSTTQFGVIAQEIEMIYPELVTTHENGIKTVNYQGLIPVLLEAIKEQQAMIESLTAALDDEKTSREDLKSALSKQQKLMEIQTQAMLSVQQENNNIKSDLDQIKALLGIKADPVNSKSVGGK